MNFGERLKKIRASKNVSVSDLAKELNKAESTVRMWETGKNKPDIDTLVNIANYFDCTTDYLLGISNFPNKKERLKFKSFSNKFDELYEELSEDYKKDFILIINKILLIYCGIHLIETDDFFKSSESQFEPKKEKEILEDFESIINQSIKLILFRYGQEPLLSENGLAIEEIDDDAFVRIALISSFELIDEVEIFTQKVMDLPESASQQFRVDYEIYRNYILKKYANSNIEKTDNNK